MKTQTKTKWCQRCQVEGVVPVECAQGKPCIACGGTGKVVVGGGDDTVARLLKGIVKVGVLEVRSRWDELDLMKAYGINKVTSRLLKQAVQGAMKGSVSNAGN